MNENINLTKILKDCPKGFEFYSSVHGKLFYDGMYIDSSASRIYFKHSNIHSIADGSPIPIIYLWDGKLYCGEGECTIFPSKDQRDWSKFSAPWYKKEKYELISNKIQEKSYGYGKLAPVFIEGAEFALENQWISVEDDLPCNHKKLLNPDDKKIYTSYVVAIIHGYIIMSRMYKLNGKWYWENDEPTYWMPIPKLPKE